MEKSLIQRFEYAWLNQKGEGFIYIEYLTPQNESANQTLQLHSPEEFNLLLTILKGPPVYYYANGAIGTTKDG